MSTQWLWDYSIVEFIGCEKVFVFVQCNFGSLHLDTFKWKILIVFSDITGKANAMVTLCKHINFLNYTQKNIY